MNSLKHLHVLVTKTGLAGNALCKIIEEKGGEATHLPTIAFAPPNDLPAFHAAIKQAGEADWLIFISPQAVYNSVPLLRQTWPNFPPHLQLAAIGENTAKALQKAGYVVSAVPLTEWTSEGLLALPQFQNPVAKKIAIVRGEGGRDCLAKTLANRGAIISHIVAYQRVLPAVSMLPYENLFKQHKINIVVGASYEGVLHLKKLLGETIWPLLQTIPLVVVSERIKMLASDLDFQRIWVAKNASNEAILELLETEGIKYVEQIR